MSSLTGFVKRIRDIMWNDAGVNGDAQRIEQMAWILFLKVYNTKEEEWRYTDRPYTSIIPEECRWNNWAADDKSGKAMTGDTLLDFVNNKLFPTLKGLNVTAATPIKKAIVKTTFEDANNYMKDGVLLRQVINIIDDLDLDDYEESHAFGEIYESILRELQSAGSSGEFYTPRAVTDFMAKTIKPKLGEKVADFACGTGGFLTSWLNELSKQVVTAEDQQEYATSIFGIEKKPFPYTLCITNMLLHGIDVPMVYHDNSLLRDVLDYTEEDQFDVILMNPPYGGHEKTEVKNHFPADLASSETADLFMSVIMYRLKQNGRAAVILPDGFLFGTDNAKIAIKEKLLSEFNLHTIIRMPHSVFAPYTRMDAGIIKDVTAITAHMNNPRRWHKWDTNIYKLPSGQQLPKDLDWDTWLGVTPYHEYNKDYHLGQWRCWYDFGMGALGDWGAHILDTAHEFLELGLPYEVTMQYANGHNDYFFPYSSTILFRFPQRKGMPPVDITWYDGLDNLPPIPAGYGVSGLDPNIPVTNQGDTPKSKLNPGKIIYTKDLIFKGGSHGSTLSIIPEEKAKEMADKLPKVPKSPSNHFENFLLACNGIEKTRSPFEINGVLSQVFSLGVMAQRLNTQLFFDPRTKQITNNEFANAMLAGLPPRKGWDEFYKL